MQREQILRGVQCLFWLAHPKLLIYAADSVLTFPHPLKKCALSLPLSIIFHIVARLWTPTDVSIHLHVCAFFFFFLTQVFISFHICASLFSTSFCSFFFFIVLFLYPISACTCFIALNFILLHASLEYLLVCFSFRLNPRATSGFLQLIYLLTPPESCYHAYFVHFRMVSS